MWKRLYEIFLCQEKYIVEIPKRFGMMDCKSITTPMEENPKKLSDSTSDSYLVDDLANTMPNICFALNTLSQFFI